MKWNLRIGGFAMVLGLAATAPAGLLGGLFQTHGGGSHGHGGDCCPEQERPIVSRPCETTYTYQRQVSNLRPPQCSTDCCEDPGCVDPSQCDNVPCDAGCAPSSGWKHRKGGLLSKLCDGFKRNRSKLCSHGADCTDPGCASECGPPVECGDPCEIAELIYESRTSCYAKDRARAVHKLGKYDCRCNPEIMATLVYSLNDSDERVRTQAADEIGDLIESGKCCCSPEVVAALSSALADCDRKVRRQAEEALELCGYEIVEGSCGGSCDNGNCVNGACHATGTAHGTAPAPATTQSPVAPAPATAAPASPAPTAEAPAADEPARIPMSESEEAPGEVPAPEEAQDAVEEAVEEAPEAAAPAPPEDAEAYFPSRYRR